MPVDLSFLRSPGAVRRVAYVTAAALALGFGYAFLAPRWYRSVVTIVPSKPQRLAGLSSLLGGDLGGLAASFDPSSSSAEVPRIAAVLQSNAVTDSVIAASDLKTRYDETYQEKARDAVWRHCDVWTLPKPSLVQLSCEDKDPAFAQRMVQQFTSFGNEAFRRVSVTSASEEVRFLEKHTVELREQANVAAERMQAFQEEHQLVDLESQARAVVSAMAGLQSEKISKQLELDYARSFSSRDEGTTQQLEAQLGVIERKLRELEVPRTQAEDAAAPRKGGKDRGLFPAALAVPKLRAQYEQLYRDRKVAEMTLVFALERLESARANEARNVSTYQVLDPPSFPTRHWWPKRLLVVALSLVLGLVGSIGFEWWRARHPRQDEGNGKVRTPAAEATSDRFA